MAGNSTALEATSLIVIMTSALIENIIAITIIIRVRSLRQNPHNLLILNLSVADLGVALTGMTFSLVSVFDAGRYLQNHEVACKVTGFFSNIFSFTHLMTVVAIAVDRVLIVTSSKALPDGLLRVYVMVAIAWFIGTLISLAPTTDVLSSVVYISELRHCTIKLEVLEFRIFFSIILFCFVLPTLVASYSVVVYTLWRQGQNLKECQLSGRRGRRACSDSKGEGIETSMYTEPNFTSNLSGEYNDKSVDQSEGESVDDLDKGIHDDAFEKGDTSCQERPHVSFPEEPENTDRAVFHNRKESSTSLASNSTEALKRSNQTDRKALAKQTKKEKRSLKVKKKNYIIQRRVSIMGGLLVLVITFCWTPYVILRTVRPDIKESVYVFAMWLAYCITVIDPIIYAFMNQRARKELIKYKNIIFSKMCSK